MNHGLSAAMLCVCLAPNPAPAQTIPLDMLPVVLKLQDQSIFTEKAWIFLPLEGDPLVITGEEPGSHDVRLPTEGLRFGYRSFRNGFFWDIRRAVTREDGKEVSQSILLRQSVNAHSGPWERVGQIDTSCGLTNYLVPLDKEGRFLGISPFFGYVKDGQASLVATFSLRNGKLELQEVIGLPFGTAKNLASVKTTTFPLPPLRPGESPNREPRRLQSCLFSPAALRPDLWLPVLLPDHLALASSRTGVIWLLSLKDGAVHRTVDLGHLEVGDMEKLGHLDHFLLAATPDADNRLIVATRSPDVLLFAKSLHTPPGSPEEVAVENRRRFKEIIKEKTDIHWWALDPETGEKESLDEGGRFPDRVPFDRQGQLRFLFTPAGKVHLHSPGPWTDLVRGMGLKMPVPPREPGEVEPADRPKPAGKPN